MLRNADAAMYRAKELGGNCYCYYTFDMNDRARRRLEMEKSLRSALSNHELILYYQPQMDAKSGRLVGFEALARWMHPEYGLLPPSKFIQIAEETGLIFSIGRWVLQQACEQMVQWRDQGHGDLRVAVNMTARQFAQEDIVQTVNEVLGQTGFDPALLCIEITESAAMKNIMGTLDTFQQLKSMGTRLSIDDFGAGHSSMNLLQKLPVDALSIDRSYVMRIADRETDGATAKAIIALAHSLGLRVTAEGVETKNHVEFLNKNNCDELQGNFFSPPVPADQVVSLFTTLNT
jgi:EAL domain-containing protein (putative c-di-GMP-specific phosphodiesterase class I)